MSFPFAETPYEPQDPIFQVIADYNEDPDPSKISLGPGTYRDAAGKPWILPSVRLAEERMALKPSHEYLLNPGPPDFLAAARTLAFGAGSPLLAASDPKKVVTIQTVAGTGAVRVACQFLKLWHSPGAPVTVWNSDPSWSNHRVMFEYAGFPVRSYPYFHAPTRGVDFPGLMATLGTAAPGDVVILHACAHNPTGNDLTHAQWRELGALLRDRQLVPVVDSAYQGFASGDLDRDAWAIRYLFGELGLTGLLCQSFSKNMGLYGERVGACHVVVPHATDPHTARAIESQLGWIVRKEFSTAGRYGATIASTIMNEPALTTQWHADMVTMSSRIAAMRQAVYDGLVQRKTPGSWQHIVSQIGMFSYTGLTKEQVLLLRKRHIYMAETGRISICGLNESNIGYFCDAVDEVVRATAT